MSESCSEECSISSPSDSSYTPSSTPSRTATNCSSNSTSSTLANSSSCSTSKTDDTRRAALHNLQPPARRRSDRYAKRNHARRTTWVYRRRAVLYSSLVVDDNFAAVLEGLERSGRKRALFRNVRHIYFAATDTRAMVQCIAQIVGRVAHYPLAADPETRAPSMQLLSRP